MPGIPVSVHEKVLESLLPARHYIQRLLCAPLPPPGTTNFDDIQILMDRIAREVSELTQVGNMLGRQLACWQDDRDTPEAVASARLLADHITGFAQLRCESCILTSEYDVRLAFLAVIDRPLKHIHAWIDHYESVTREPEAWRGKEVKLTLILEANDEIDALSALLQRKLHAMIQQKQHELDHAMAVEGLSEIAKPTTEKKRGVARLLSAFIPRWWSGSDQ